MSQRGWRNFLFIFFFLSLRKKSKEKEMDASWTAVALSCIVFCFMVHRFLAENNIPTFEFLQDLWFVVQCPFLVVASDLAFLLDPHATERRAGFVINVKCIVCYVLCFVAEQLGFGRVVPPLPFVDPMTVAITRDFTCTAKEMRGVTRLPDGTIMRCSVRVLLCITMERYAGGRIVVTQRITSDPACQRDPEFLLDGGVETAPLPVPDTEPAMPER